eukprot:4293460-Heterocapsa_arctica.AAC.1
MTGACPDEWDASPRMGRIPGAVPSVPVVPAFPWENSGTISKRLLSMGHAPTPKNGAYPSDWR